MDNLPKEKLIKDEDFNEDDIVNDNDFAISSPEEFNASDLYPHFNDIKHHLWLAVSEAAKLGGVTPKTIRRALQEKKIKYKIINNRYLIEFFSVVIFLRSKTKLHNKLDQYGIGQYIDKWKI